MICSPMPGSLRSSKLILAVLLSLIMSSSCQRSQPMDIDACRSSATEAYLAKDYPRFLEFSEKLVEAAPDNYLFSYYLANACVLAGDTLQALETIEFLIEADYDLIHAIENDPDFAGISGDPRFQRLLKAIHAKAAPVVTSTVAFSIPEKDLIPEGIAFDPVRNDFYLGSLHKCKIIRFSENGLLSDFTVERQDGLLPVVGMKVDAERRHLWAASGYGYDKVVTLPDSLYGTTGVFKYDLDSGRLLKKYMIPGEGRFLNDLVVGSNGDVYITDSLMPSLFVIYAEVDSLVKLKELPRPGNGIAFNLDESKLYIAGGGIGVLDLETMVFTELEHPSNMYLCGDGLYFHENSLITICLDMVSQYHLDKTGGRIVSRELLDAWHPDYNAPTTGVITGMGFYYIANSQLGDYDESGVLFPLSELEETKILRIEL